MKISDNIEKREERNNSFKISYIKGIKEKKEKELNQICDGINKIIDKYLLPNSPNLENKIF